MTGDIDPFDFVLAEQLGGRTIEEWHQVMSNQEYVMWRAFYKFRTAMQELEITHGRENRD